MLGVSQQSCVEPAPDKGSYRRAHSAVAAAEGGAPAGEGLRRPSNSPLRQGCAAQRAFGHPLLPSSPDVAFGVDTTLHVRSDMHLHELIHNAIIQ